MHTPMKLKRVESEMIESVGYDEELRVLDVVFSSGDKYRYEDVPPFEYEGLMVAESKGQYMHKRIIGRFKYKRIS